MPNAWIPTLVFLTLLLVSTDLPKAFAKSSDCPPAVALLPASDPVYPDAMSLSQELREHGFKISGVFPSKLGSIFVVEDKGALRSTIEGDVVFCTNYGDIEVAFMPKPQTFEHFKVTEHRVRDGWWYSFAGTPRVWKANHFGSARSTYFMKGGSQMFILSEGELRSRLIRALLLSSNSAALSFLPTTHLRRPTTAF